MMHSEVGFRSRIREVIEAGLRAEHDSPDTHDKIVRMEKAYCPQTLEPVVQT
jgi:hypothetical protein